MNIEKFSTICKMSQPELKDWLKKEINKEYEEGDGYIFFEGKLPILLVAHLDTVHKELPTKILISEDRVSAKEGIGGDDRCGVYSILEILKEYDVPVLFCEDEELGCQGAEKFVYTDLCKKLQYRFKYLIELDRMGYNDAVYYECGNKELKDFIASSGYWTEEEGIYSDVLILGPWLGSAYVNLSCGYFNAHTKNEYVVPSAVDMCIKETKKLINKVNECKYFEFRKDKNYSSWYSSDDENEEDDDYWYSFLENYNL